MALYTASQLVSIVSGRPYIDPGRLRSAITIYQRRTTSPLEYDSSGAVLSERIAFVTAMAAIEALRGTDVIRSGQTTTQLFLTIGMWFQSGILASMEVQNDDNGSVYLIQSVENVREMDSVLLLNCIGLGANQ